MLIAGPSGSGKTLFLYRLLKYRRDLINPCPDYIMLHFIEYQPIYGQMKREGLVDELIQEIPSYEEIRDKLIELRNQGKTHIIAAFDDSKASIFSVCLQWSKFLRQQKKKGFLLLRSI